MKYRGLPAKVNITNVYANPNSDIILPTVPENIKYRELPAAVNTTAVPFVPNVPSLLKTVLTDVPDTTPVTVVPPASLIPTATFLQSLVVRWDVPLITPALNVHLATPTLVPVFPADLMPTVPVALVTATQDTKSAMVPVYLIHPAAADALLTKPAKTVAA